MGYRVVVVGATGNVGREMLNILAERQFPLDELAAVASPRSTGGTLSSSDFAARAARMSRIAAIANIVSRRIDGPPCARKALSHIAFTRPMR